MTKSPSGCLLSHNADVSIDYNYGVSPGPRILLWNCANIAGHTRVGAEAFFIYSGASACHVERSVLWKQGDCSARATAPANPLVAGTIQILNTPRITFIGAGTYAVSVDVRVTNTGNLTLFGPTVETFSDPLSFGELSTLGGSPTAVSYVLVGQSLTRNGMPMLSTNVVSGQTFTFSSRLRAMITDSVVFPLNITTSGTVTAP